jgi:hypothetical protein
MIWLAATIASCTSTGASAGGWASPSGPRTASVPGTGGGAEAGSCAATAGLGGMTP